MKNYLKNNRNHTVKTLSIFNQKYIFVSVFYVLDAEQTQMDGQRELARNREKFMVQIKIS
jgi:hypothetical protein